MSILGWFRKLPLETEGPYAYERYGSGYVVFRKDDDTPVVGDQLPKTEEEAILMCRVANNAALSEREKTIKSYESAFRSWGKERLQA